MPTEEERRQFDLPELHKAPNAEDIAKLDALVAQLKPKAPNLQPIMTRDQINKVNPPRLDWAQVGTLVGSTSQQMIGILMPFLPALARVPVDVYNAFLSHLGNAEWDNITTLMYEHMTVPEREALEDAVYVQLRAATLAQYQDIQLLKSVLTNLAIDLLKTLVTTVIL
jgi:hypothetical protein